MDRYFEVENQSVLEGGEKEFVVMVANYESDNEIVNYCMPSVIKTRSDIGVWRVKLKPIAA